MAVKIEGGGALTVYTSTPNRIWYRIYSDNWCEQGDWDIAIPSESGFAIEKTLFVPMVDLTYSVKAFGTQVDPVSHSTYGTTTSISSIPLTTTTILIGQYNAANVTQELGWEAKGFSSWLS